MDETNEREGRVITSVPADTFDHRLMLARSHAGRLTIHEAATRCGLSPQSWSNWEKGKVPRDILDVAEAVADGLEIDRDWLLYGGALSKPVRAGRVRRPLTVRGRRPGGRRPIRLDRHERQERRVHA